MNYVYTIFALENIIEFYHAWEKPDNDEGRFKYELRVKFNYQEVSQNNSIQEKSIDLVSNVTVHPTLGNSEMTYYYWDNNFFASCENNIPYDDPNEEDNIKERYTVDIEMIESWSERVVPYKGNLSGHFIEGRSQVFRRGHRACLVW